VAVTNRPKIKGTAAESAVVRYLQANGFPTAERRTLSGSKDRGDIGGIVGVVIEVKDVVKTALGPWLREATVEAVNAHAPIGVVWHKRRGTTNPGEWFVTMDGETFIKLISDDDAARLADDAKQGADDDHDEA
jgi:hypothetical protein